MYVSEHQRFDLLIHPAAASAQLFIAFACELTTRKAFDWVAAAMRGIHLSKETK